MSGNRYHATTTASGAVVVISRQPGHRWYEARAGTDRTVGETPAQALAKLERYLEGRS